MPDDVTDQALSGEAPSPKPGTGRGYVSISSREVDKRWRPTYAQPMQQHRCTAIKADNTRCTNNGLAGLDALHSVCRKHGGTLQNVAQMANAQLEAARLELVDSAFDAVRTLVDLQRPGTAEGIRLKAAESILDRVGIRGGFEVAVEVEDRGGAASIVMDNLRRLREAQEAQARALESLGAPPDLDGELDGDPEGGGGGAG